MRRWPFIALAALGLALSLALEFSHVRAYLAPSASSFCTVGERIDCTSVALSRYSVALGVPVPLWGALGFLAIGVAALRRSRWLLVLSGCAALISLGLLVVEVVLIGSLCLLCEAVHLVCFVLFALAWRSRRELVVPFAARDELVLVFAPVLGIFLALALFLPRYWGVFGWKGDLPYAQGKTPEGYPWIGATTPELVLHEFTDYVCPHCRVASTRTLRRLADHPQKLRVVRRQYPRMRCPKRVTSCIPVRIAYCAEEQGKFWQADRWLFERMASRTRLEPAEAALALELDLAKLESCLGRDDIYRRAEDEALLAIKKRIPGSPYYLLGDRRAAESELDDLLRGLQ